MSKNANTSERNPLDQDITDMSKNANTSERNPLDQDITDMISTLSSHLTNPHRAQKQGSSSTANDEDADESGTRIITIAGTNVGATMNGELDDVGLEDEHEACGTYVNSNFQAVNNSIMLGGSYTSNDPGVQVEISDIAKPHNTKPEKAILKEKEKAAAI